MKRIEKDKIAGCIIIVVLIIFFGVLTFQAIGDLFSYIEIKNNGIKDEAIIVDVKEKYARHRTWS